MKTRAEAAKKLNDMMKDWGDNVDKSIPHRPERYPNEYGPDAHHFGRQELRQFMDWFYGGPPNTDDEKIASNK